MSKRLITDRDITSGAVRPPLVLDGGTLITPSARDRAVRLGWAIVEPSAGAPNGPAGGAMSATGGACPRCGGAGCAGGCVSCTSSARLDALADGLYLVRIEKGALVSALPASGPGRMVSAQAAMAARRGRAGAP